MSNNTIQTPSHPWMMFARSYPLIGHNLIEHREAYRHEQRHLSAVGHTRSTMHRTRAEAEAAANDVLKALYEHAPGWDWIAICARPAYDQLDTHPDAGKAIVITYTE